MRKDPANPARKILDAAKLRDEVSASRDADADERELSASRAAFLDPKHHDSHQPDLRRAAALDRDHSKLDRTSAAVDRVKLAGGDGETTDKSRPDH